MPRCEDYPCCGHEAGGCPNHDGSFNCATCGKKLPKNSQSSLCSKCLRRMEKRSHHDPYGDFDMSMNG